MRNRLVTALLAVVVLFVSVGCDNVSPTAPKPPTPPNPVSSSLTIELANSGTSGMTIEFGVFSDNTIIGSTHILPMTLSGGNWTVMVGDTTLSKMAEGDAVFYYARWTNKVWTAKGLDVQFSCGTTTKGWTTDSSSLYRDVAGDGKDAAKMRATNGGDCYSIMQLCPGGGADSCPTPS